MQGFFNINRVPGKFYISSNPHIDLIIGLVVQGYTFDFTHYINHVSMGRQEDIAMIESTFNKEGLLRPLTGYKFIPRYENDTPFNLETNFQLTAVGSVYEDTNKNTYSAY